MSRTPLAVWTVRHHLRQRRRHLLWPAAVVVLPLGVGLLLSPRSSTVITAATHQHAPSTTLLSTFLAFLL